METQTLKPQTVRSAYYWTMIGLLAKNVCGFGISMLLARFLQPADYGLVGLVTVLINIVFTLQDFGLSQAVVYFPDDEDVLPTAFTVTTLVGTVLTLGTIAGAPLVAAFYKEPRLIAVIRVLSVILLLAGLRSASQGLMTKKLQFRRLTVLEGTGTLLAGVVGVVMAWMGYGVWSLVANIVLGSFIQTVLTMWIVRPRLTLSLNIPVLKKMMKWGMPLTGSTLLWQFYENADFMVIGKLMGPGPLGFYTMAFRLSTIVNDKISSVVNRVSFPSLSAMQNDSKKLVEHWFSVTRKLALVNFPLLAVLAVNGDDLIHTMLGDRWMPAVAPLRFLCLVGAIKTLVSIISILINVYGRTDLTFYVSCFNAVVMPIAFVIGCKLDGLVGVAIAWCLVHPLRGIIQLKQATGLAQIPMWSYVANLKFPLLTTAVTTAAMLPIHWALSPGLLRLTTTCAAGMVASGVCLLSREDIRNQLRKILENDRLSFLRSR